MTIRKIKRSEKFKKDYKKIARKSPDLKFEVDDCIKDLFKDPIPRKRRFKKYTEYDDPNRYSVHVTSNHSHKISLQLDGETAMLRRVSTHGKVDADP